MRNPEVFEVRVYDNGNRYWYQNGWLHRLDGAACENQNGRLWYKNGKLHNAHGPAAEFKDGSVSWYIEGVRMTQTEFEKWSQPTKELTVAEIEERLGYRVKVVKE